MQVPDRRLQDWQPLKHRELSAFAQQFQQVCYEGSDVSRRRLPVNCSLGLLLVGSARR
jgi:hypothetical protein